MHTCRVCQHPTDAEPDAPTPPDLVSYGGACSRCQHMSHWSLSHIGLHALCFLSHIGYAHYALSRMQLSGPTHMLSRLGAASNRRCGAQQYARTSGRVCLSIDVRALAWLACNKGNANMYGWKQNGNIPNRIASFSVFNPIESVFSCPTSPFSFLFSFSYFKCKSRKWFRHFLTIFYFSIFNLKISRIQNWLPIITVQATRQRQVWTLMPMDRII
jgi:hypothetical protein